MVKASNKTIGLVGGTFDPAHKGHIAITKIAIKKLNLSHLIIPKVRQLPSFLVEERLPISPEDMKNMKLYSSNQRAFNEVVAEMVTLFSKLSLKYLRSSFEAL